MASLTYFDGRGLGEGIRLMLAATSTPFTDVVATREWFADAKDSTLLFGQLPLLSLPPHTAVQSMSAIRYIARKNGLYPHDPELALSADMIADSIRDALGAFTSLPFVAANGDANAVAEGTARAAATIEKTFPRLEAILVQQAKIGSSYFVGQEMSYPDVTSIEILEYAAEVFPASDLASRFPALAAHHTQMLALPGVAAYMGDPTRRREPGGKEYVDHVGRVLGRSVDAVALEVQAKYHVEFNGFLTNHATHAAAAFHGLFPSPHIWRPLYNAFMRFYADRLDASEPSAVASPTGSPEEIAATIALLSGDPSSAIASLRDTKDNTTRSVGPTSAPVPWRAAVAAAHAVLVEDAGESSLGSLLSPSLRLMAAGLHSAAFHAFIHLGWGLGAQSPHMMAEGWIYMLSSFVPLWEPSQVDAVDLTLAPTSQASQVLYEALNLPTLPPARELAEALHSLSGVLDVDAIISAEGVGGFQSRMRAVGAHSPTSDILAELFARLVPIISSWITPSSSSSPSFSAFLGALLVDAALVAYHASHHEFFILHAVTSAHALRALADVVDEDTFVHLAAGWMVSVVTASAVEHNPWHDDRVDHLFAQGEGNAKSPKEAMAAWLDPLSGKLPDEHILKLAYVIHAANSAPEFSSAESHLLLSSATRNAILVVDPDVTHFLIDDSPSVCMTVISDRDAW